MVRGFADRWRENLASAGQVAWEIAVAAGPAHQAAGHDVAVPQFLGRPDFLAGLENAASDDRSPAYAQSTRKSEPLPR
jgi:hypothetical protein